MNSKGSLSVSDKLLIAAHRLEKGGKSPFTAEDLVVAGWRHFPDTFGLAGYRDDRGGLLYPDSNRVFAEIMGSKPIRMRGFIKKVGKKMYQLTEVGRAQAKTLNNGVGLASKIGKAALSREITNQLKRLFSSKAMEKFKKKKTLEVTFFDACSFWGISPRSSAIELEGKLSICEKIIDNAKEVVKNNATFEHGGDIFGRSDLDKLFQLHIELLEKFKEEIKVIRQRKDER